MIYDLTTLALRPNTLGAVNAALPDGLATGIRDGRLLGCFSCEFGILNRFLVLSAYDSLEALSRDRAHVIESRNPFGIGAYLNGLDRGAYEPLPFMADIAVGAYGPLYEVRSYEVAAGGLAETAEAWGKVVEQRQAISKLLMVMASVDTAPQRMVHFWPYPNASARMDARAAASQAGLWPPPGGSTHLLSLKSELFQATKFSPLQ